MEAKEIMPAGKFTKVQLDLLKLFSRNITDEELFEIKGLISQYFAEKATREMDSFLQENNLNDSKIKEWSVEHMRTAYKK